MTTSPHAAPADAPAGRCGALPVADPATTRRAASGWSGRTAGPSPPMLALNALAAGAGLAGPGCSAGSSTRSGRRRRRHRGPAGAGHRGLRAGAAAAGALRPVRRAPVRRADPGAGPRAVRGPGAGAARLRGRAGRHRRSDGPRHADVAAVGTTLRDAGPDVLIAAVAGAVPARRGRSCSTRCSALCGAARAARHLVRASAGICAGRAPRTSPRARPNSALAEHAGGHRRRAPAPSRRSGCRSAGSAASRRRIETVPPHPAPARCSCAACSSRPWRSPTSFPVAGVLLVGGVLHGAGRGEPGRGGRRGAVSAAAGRAAGRRS